MINQMISTGLEKLDEFLLGGIHNCVITDIYGGNGTGKTQLLLQICINSIKNGGTVLYLDTTGNFRPERIIEMQKNHNSDYDLLERITVLRIANTSEQINSIEIMKNQSFSLIVIDNITDLFSYEYQNEDLIFEKNTLFMRFMRELSHVSLTKKIPIVITNMVRNFEGNEIENLKSAIDPFTHIKIKLSKTSSKFQGEIKWLNHSSQFSYKIDTSGLTHNTEDI